MVLHIGQTNVNQDYYIDKNCSQKLRTIEHEKDVGVTFSTDLKFDLHISNVINKANQMIVLGMRWGVNISNFGALFLYLHFFVA